MNINRFIQYGALVLFLSVTCAALCFTFFRVKVGFIPWKLTHYSYSMIAPYRGYGTKSEGFFAQGLRTDGTWEDIDLSYYIPVFKGERIARLHLRHWKKLGEDIRLQKYHELAELLLVREPEYVSIRLFHEYWDKSPDGYYANRIEPLIDREFLGQAP